MIAMLIAAGASTVLSAVAAYRIGYYRGHTDAQPWPIGRATNPVTRPWGELLDEAADWIEQARKDEARNHERLVQLGLRQDAQ